MVEAGAGRRTVLDPGYVLRVIRVVSVAEFKLKYADSALGYVWSVAKPLALFSVLYVVFGRFFKLNLGFEHYPVYLLVGIVLWTFFVDTTNMSLWTFVANRDVLRKLAFPRIVLPISATVTTMLTFLVNTVAVAALIVFDGITPRTAWLLLPFLAIELYLFTLSVAVVLATLFVRVRDVGQVWDLVTQLVFFASPIIYPVGFLPQWAQYVVFANPFVQIMQDVRSIIVPQAEAITAADVYGTPLGYLIPLATLTVLALVAAWYYRREEPYLAERT